MHTAELAAVVISCSPLLSRLPLVDLDADHAPNASTLTVLCICKALHDEIAKFDDPGPARRFCIAETILSHKRTESHNKLSRLVIGTSLMSTRMEAIWICLRIPGEPALAARREAVCEINCR